MNKMKVHPTESELADYLGNSLKGKDRARLEEHIAGCKECLENIVSAHESVREFYNNKKEKKSMLKKINPYLACAILAFLLSFAMPRFFLQFLVATLLLGAKWIIDAKSTRMLVMIYEAWKNGGEKETSRILEKIGSGKRL